MKEIMIAGGGLAGLGLACGLRRLGVPTTLHEAGRYPRHRVCGEFISGLGESTLEQLGLVTALSDALRHGDGAWFWKGETVWRFELPEAALAVSRHRLDQRLKETLEASGGRVVEGSRQGKSPQEGFVWAAGRQDRSGRWIGLKGHVLGLDLEPGLEMHLGENGYAGLTPVEDGRVNVCGLFRLDRSRRVRGGGPGLLLDYLRAGGNTALAERLEACSFDEGSCLGTAGFEMGWGANPEDNGADPLCVLGDASAMIPPFTGNGMSMAFESAELALGPLLAWSAGDVPWSEALARIRRDARARFAGRIRRATAIQNVILHPAGALFARTLARSGLLPFGSVLSLVR